MILRRAITTALVSSFVACVSAAPPIAVDTSVFAGADWVHVTGNSTAGTQKDGRDITDPAQIGALYRLVSTQPGDWHRFAFDGPLLQWSVEFRRKGKSLGSCGVGANFLAVDSYVLNLQPDQQRLAARLLGTSSRSH